MGELLIPFGIHRESGSIVEPEDAAKGRACNCLCPGCKAPLLSRHPKINRYHFAHDTRHELAKPELECPFSSPVAVAMMVRELADSLTGLFIHTPNYQVLLKHPCCDKRHDWVQISHAACVEIAQSIANAEHFDLKLKVGGYPILIDLVYKGKPATALDEVSLQTAKAGVLALDCDSFSMPLFRKGRSGRFSDAVTDFVLNTGKRKWCYHPRQVARLEAARESHQCRRGFNPMSIREPYTYPEPTTVVHRKPEKPQPSPEKLPEPKKYHCVLCDRDWVQHFIGPPNCPGCQSHLYAREV